MSPARPLRVYVDHGEAYGNLGDEAMLLNAVRRLRHHLGDVILTLPVDGDRPLPESLGPVETVPSPRVVLDCWARRLRLPVAALRRLPLAGRFVPVPAWELWLSLAAALATALLAARRRGAPPALLGGLRPFAEALERADAFYGVGAADFSDFWLSGVVYKSWLYRAVRPWVRASVLAAQGIGPLETPWARRTMARGFEALDLLSFRDAWLSQRIVEDERPAGVRWRRVGDEAFSLPPAPAAAADRLLEEAGLAPGTPFVAVHFRTTDYTRDTTDLIPRVAALLDRVLERIDGDLVFFPMSYHAHSRDDAACGRAIGERMARRARFHVAPLERDVTIVKRAVGLARYTLGLSYHVHVFALSQGSPCLILYTGDYYRAKSEGLVGFYGAPCAALDLSAADDASVLESVYKLESEIVSARARIAAVNAEMGAVNDWTQREMARLLGRESGEGSAARLTA